MNFAVIIILFVPNIRFLELRKPMNENHYGQLNHLFFDEQSFTASMNLSLTKSQYTFQAKT